MTEGEKMIWAAAYAAELSRRLNGIPDLKDDYFSEFIVDQAAKSATFADLAVALSGREAHGD
jgi:hypothetical protein